jgi:hypothetical protein
MTTLDPETLVGFNKLFRPTPTRQVGKIPEPTSAPPAGNKVHSAIFECVRRIRSGNDVNSFPSPVPDLTVMEVPPNFHSAGSNVQSMLSQMEGDYSVHCGFVSGESPKLSSFVVIVGLLRPRRAAELKIMATIENKQRGFYSDRIVRKNMRVCDWPWYVATEPFDTDSYPIPEKDLSFALGQRGSIRKKLAMAAGCIMEYVGEVAYMSGTLKERTQSRDYLRWVLQQLEGEVNPGDFARRADVSSIMLTKRAAGFVNGNKGRVLRTIEEVTGTFCFIARSIDSNQKPLLVCGPDVGREAAIFVLDRYIKKNQANDWGGDAVAASAEISKPAILETLKQNSIKLRPPMDPWKSGSNEPGDYRYFSQPCPGAARLDTELLPVDAPSTIVITRKTSSKKIKPVQEEFTMDDEAAFPSLGGGFDPVASTKRTPVTQSPAQQVSPPPEEETPISPPPPPPAPKPEVVKRPQITIDRENHQVWGDWGLGPLGDPTVKGAVGPVTASPPQLQGAWK